MQKQSEYFEPNWPWKMIWKSKAPIKVACFGWVAIREACVTQDNLQRRGFMLSNTCYLCEEDLESVNNLFIHCKVVKQCWELFLNLCGVVWVMPSDVRSLLESWNGQKIANNQKKFWRTIPWCIFRTIWTERNSACFENKKNHISRVNDLCLQNLLFFGVSGRSVYGFL